MTQIDDPRILFGMGSHDLARSVTAGIIHDDNVVNEVRDRFKDLPDQFFFIVGRNDDSNGFISVHNCAASKSQDKGV
jgi:hypothetical protein